jgi:hypothetical protein
MEITQAAISLTEPFGRVLCRQRRNLLPLIHCLLLSFTCMAAQAEPWIRAGDESTRHHLQTLVDTGVINTTATAWPLMWSHIKQELDTVDLGSLNESQLWSYRYLRHELRKAMRPAAVEQRNTVSNTVTSLGYFGTDHRERYESSLGVNYTGTYTSFQIQAAYVHEPADEVRLRWDGSYLSGLLGNWAVGVGAIDRWWGPGWESSLILSHNARPVPGVFLQRHSSEPFSTPLLSWLGPWQMITFMSQLETDRDYAQARLWGMRINFKPLRSLDIGLSRTAIWAGEGRPGDIDTFVNLLIGRDNRGGSNIAEDGSNEPGNQLAGFDLRWSYSLGNFSGSLYGQMIGEDEAGGMPSRYIGMGGIELQTLLYQTHLRLSLEGQNTTVYFYDSDKFSPDVAYEHSIYNSGYRYRGRPIGASSDNDSEAYHLRGQLHFPNGSRLNIGLGRWRFNVDGSNEPPPGGSRFPETNTNLLQVSYAMPLNSVVMLDAGVFHYSNNIYYAGRNIDSGGYLSLQSRW